MWFLLYFLLVVHSMTQTNVRSDSCKRVIMEFESKAHTVRENSCVAFTCEAPLDSVVVITKNEGDIIVRNSELQDDRNRFVYRYDTNSSTNISFHTLTIRSVMKEDFSLWKCVYQHSVKLFHLKVLYRPSDDEPLCVTKNQWPHYLINDSLNLNCSTSIGNPEVDLFINVSESLKTSIVSNQTTTRKEILVNQTLDKTSNGTYINCSASRVYSKDVTFPPFHSSCVWGPIMLFQNLTITLKFLNNSAYKGFPLSFECSCNIPDALLNLEFSPSLLNRSHFEPGRSTITVDIPEDVNSTNVMIRCEATYRKKQVNATEIIVISKSKNYLHFLVVILVIVVGTFSVIFIIALPVSILVAKNRARKEINRTKKAGAPPYTPVRPCGSHDSLKQGELVLRRLSATTKDCEDFSPIPPKRLSASMTPTASIKRNCSLSRTQYNRDLPHEAPTLMGTEYNVIPAESPSRLSISDKPNSLITNSYFEQSNVADEEPTHEMFPSVEYDSIPPTPSPSIRLGGSLRRSLKKTNNSFKKQNERLAYQMPYPSSFDDVPSNEREKECIPPILPLRSSVSMTPENSLKRSRSSRRGNDDKELVILSMKPSVTNEPTETVYDSIPSDNNLHLESSVVSESVLWETNATYDENEKQFISGNLPTEDSTPENVEYDCIPSF